MVQLRAPDDFVDPVFGEHALMHMLVAPREPVDSIQFMQFATAVSHPTKNDEGVLQIHTSVAHLNGWLQAVQNNSSNAAISAYNAEIENNIRSVLEML